MASTDFKVGLNPVVGQNLGLNLTAARPLPSPAELHHAFPTTLAQSEFVDQSRNAIRQIMLRLDRRLVVVVGPCSIHDVEAGYEYASRLASLAHELDDRLLIVMRAFFEKPRTSLGWPGLVFDPLLDASGDVGRGLHVAREFLGDVLDLRLPTATEFLAPMVPHYLADRVCWAAIGARTTESQPHRQLASALAMPVGFKNGTDGRLQAAINALNAARSPHTLVGLLSDGRAGTFCSSGNPDVHLVLRGGASGPNFSAMHVHAAEALLTRENLPRAVMVDCSHDNSGRRAEQQTHVLRDVLGQLANGNQSIFGVMLESHLVAGRQPIAPTVSKLRYGISVTDSCLDWSTTETCLRETHAALATRFAGGARNQFAPGATLVGKR